EVLELQTKPGRDISVGSRSIIIQLMNLNLIDELQLCIYTVIAGSVQPLFENINHSRVLQLSNTKTFTYGAFLLYYTVTKNTATRLLKTKFNTYFIHNNQANNVYGRTNQSRTQQSKIRSGLSVLHPRNKSTGSDALRSVCDRRTYRLSRRPELHSESAGTI